MKTYQCQVCGWIYDEAKGCPEDGIPAGTRWEDLPESWCCPHCGVGKGDFEMLAIAAEATGPAASMPDSMPADKEFTSAALVILGSGLAAYTLAREFRKIDKATSLLLVTRDGGGFYAKPSLSNALANRKTPEQLQTKTAGQMGAELDAQILTHSEIAGIDSVKRQLTLADGRQLAYGRLVIACGADPIRLTFEGDGAGDVQSVNDLDDYSRFFSSLENAKSVAVIGAGLIGCEFANDLAASQIKASVIDPAAWPLSRLLPEAAGKPFASALQGQGVEFHFGTSVKGVWKDSSGYRLELADGRQVMADQILSAIGLRPRTALAQAGGISCQRGIIANHFLETDVDGVYALGDCAEISGLHLPFVLPIMHQARALARTLSGTPTALTYPAMPVVVKTPACPTIVCPPAAGAEGSWQCQSVDGGLQACFHDAAGKLLGFALLGGATSQSQELAAQLPALLP
jgi:rubredoxin-NAD+ reductase